MAQRGHTVSMICLDYGQPAVSNIGGITVYRAFKPRAGIPLLRFLHPRLTYIWSCLNRADANIYYTRAAGILPGIVAHYCKRHSRKSVFAAAGNPDFDRKTSRIRFRRDRGIYEYGLRHSDALVAQNREQVSRCQRNFKRTPILIENCYPPPDHSNMERGSYVLWVSTIRNIKQPEIFLDLARRLPEFTFVMVGGPDNRQHELFEEIARRVKSISNLKFIGYVPYSEIDRYFDNAKLVVNTSESEGFPNTFLQAWSRGIPTVSFVDCGARENERIIGRLVGNENEMVEEVATLMKDESVWADESRKCRSYFNQNHLPEIVFSKYELLFGGLMGLKSCTVPKIRAGGLKS